MVEAAPTLSPPVPPGAARRAADPTASCLYRGVVLHHRPGPPEHRFRYTLSWLYLNLTEGPPSWPGLLRRGGFGLARHRRADFLGDPAEPLADAARRRVREAGLALAGGPVCLLTLPRAWGRFFCPLSLYYCFDPAGARVEAVVAEVSNTPWRERHTYVLTPNHESRARTSWGARHVKAFHVSPFLEMGLDYAWRLTAPGDTLAVSIDCRRDGQRRLAAAMRLQRHPLTSGALLWDAARRPGGPNRVLAAIYFEALRLWLKRCPYFPHP